MKILGCLIVACAAVGSATEALGGDEPCLAFLIPPTAEVISDPSLLTASLETRKDWIIGVPHPGTVFYLGNKIKLDGPGTDKKAGGCEGRDVQTEGGLVRLWFEPDRLRGEAFWVRLADVHEFRWPSPGGWNSQNVATNITSLKSWAAKALERIVKEQREESGRQEGASAGAPSTAGAVGRAPETSCDEERLRLRAEVERLRSELARLSAELDTLSEHEGAVNGAIASPDPQAKK